MFFRDMNNTSFVYLDDISGTPEPLNKVIYNPNVDDKNVMTSDEFYENWKHEVIRNDLKQWDWE